jgi:hypothetical protein
MTTSVETIIGLLLARERGAKPPQRLTKGDPRTLTLGKPP